MKRKVLRFLGLILICFCISGCTVNTNKKVDHTAESRTPSINSSDQQNTVNKLLDCIKGSSDDPIDIDDTDIETDAEVKNSYFFNGSVYPIDIDDTDIETDAEVKNSYFFNGSVYIETNNSMYRFQMNKDGKFTGYIKYSHMIY